MQQLSANQSCVKRDHDYVKVRDSSTSPWVVSAGKTKEGNYEQQKLINDLYNHHVCMH